MKKQLKSTTTHSDVTESLLRFLRQHVRAAYMAAPAAFALGFTPIARANTLDWDPALSGGTALGGAGTWDNVNLGNWWDGAGLVQWNNINGDVARFGGTPGTGAVTIGTGGVNANGLVFNTGGYTLSGAALTLDDPNATLLKPVIQVTNLADSATITAVVAGINGMEKTGAGTLVLSGANTISGGLRISAGTLKAVAIGAGTTNTGTGVTTAAVNNPLGAGSVTLNGGTLDLAPLATVNQTGLSGRTFSAAAPLNNDSTNVVFTGTASGTRYDANLNRYDLTTASGGGTALSPTTSVAAQWTGKLQITSAGAYRFFVASDDGSRVFIDGVLAVNNDGSKGTTDLGGQSIALSAGLHDVRVDYTQGTGGGAVVLSYAGGSGLDVGATETAIPQSVLFTAESNSTAGASNAVIMGAGSGAAVSVAANSSINLSGTMFTQAQVGGLTNTTGTTLTVNGLAGKTLRLAGASTLTGTLTIVNTPDVAFDGVLAGTGVTLVKQGAGRMIFNQTAVANTIDAASLIELQGGTGVLIGGVNNPIGAAGLRLNGGNLVIDSKGGPQTYANAINVAQNGSIQSIVSGASATTQPIQTVSGAISINSGATLTFDAISGGVTTANNPTGVSTDLGAQITASGVISGPGGLNAISTSFGSVVTPGTIVLSNGGNTFSGAVTVNGSTFVGNTSIPVNGPTLRIGATGALPSTATSAIAVKSGILDFATNNVAYSVNAANPLTLGGGPATTTSGINIGTGNLTLNSDVVFDASTNSGVGTIKGNGAATGILDLNTAGQRTINVGDSTNAPIDLIINAVVNATGGGGLTKTGLGTLALQANVASQSTGYTGLTQVSAGTLIIGGGSGFASDAAIKGNIQVDSGATLKLGQGNIIINTSALTINGTMELSGLQDTVGSLSGNGTITSSVGTGGTATFLSLDMPTNAMTFSGTVTGQAGLALGGRLLTAPITIPTSQFAALTYTGDTIVGDAFAGATTGNAVTLQLSGNNALPFGYNRGDLRVMGAASGSNKGIFDLNGFNQSINGLIGSGAVVGTITNNGTADSTLTMGFGATSATANSFNGIIQDGTTNKVILVKNGLGSQTLTGANSYTGTTTINGGRLAIGNATALGSTATGTTVNAGGYLDIVNITSAEPLTLFGKGQPVPVTAAGTGGPMFTGSLVGSGGVAGVQSGAITLGSDVSVGVAKGNALTISGVISGAFGLTKTLGDVTTGGSPGTIGAGGTLVLTGTNLYTGPTTIESGELRLQNAGGLAIASTLVNLSNNGAQGILGTGTANASSNGVVLTLGASNQMPSNVVINWNNRGLNAKFQLNGFNQTIKGFTGDSGISGIIQNFETGGAGTSILTVDTAGTDTAFNGRIRNQTGVLGITKAGAGTLTLSGINAQAANIIAYTGQTTISGGKLVLEDTTGFVSPIQNNVAGSGALEFKVNYGRSYGYSAALTEPAATGAGFTKTGKGALLLTGANGQYAMTGAIAVNDGVLVVQGPVGANTLLPATATINVAAGGQLDLWGGAFATPTTYSSSVVLNGNTAGGALVIGGINAASDTALTGSLTLAGAGVMSNVATGWADHVGRITGVISGPGGLQIEKQNYTQQPLGLQITNAGNSYSGGTTINGGTVYFANGSLPSTGNLQFGGYSTASSQFTLSGPNLVLGATGINGGFTRAIGTGSGQVSFTGEGGGFSALGAAQTVNFGGAAAAINWGAAGLDGGASLWFNNSTSITASGGAFNADNVVTVANDINLGTGMRRVYVVNNNAVTTDWATFSGVISGTGGLIKDGGNSAAAANLGGILVFSGAGSNTYTGLTNVIGGAIGLEKTGGATAIAGDLHVSNLQGGSRRIIYLGANDQIADTSTITFAGQSGQNGDFRLFGFNETVGAIQDRSGGGVIEIAEAGDLGYRGVAINTALSSTLTVGGSIGSPVNTDSFYNGFLRTQSGGTGVLNLVKNGSGTFTISAGQQSGNGSQTYNGTTTINGGTVLFNNIATYNSPITVNTGANVGFNTTLGQNLTEVQVISGVGNLLKSGPGILALSGANAYSGTTTVNGGTLNITGTTTAGQTGNYTVNSNGVLLIGNGTTGGVLTANNNIAVNGTGILAFSRNGALTHSGIVSGTGNVDNRSGAGGVITLSAANTYSGTTTTSGAGVLNLGGSGVSAGGLFVNAGGTLNADFSQAGSSASNVLASTANATMTNGNLNFTGAAAGTNTQTLGTLTAGTLAAQNATFTALTNTLNLTAGAGGTLGLTLGGINHQVGGALYVNMGVGTTLNVTSPDGALNGFTYLPANAGFLGVASGVVNNAPTYTADTWTAGQLIDVTTSSTQAAASTASALRFNATGNSVLTLSGANIISTGGILVTPTATGNNSITGGSISGSATDGLTINQSGGGVLTIGSTLTGTGGLTKVGSGFTLLTGTNTYTGGTAVTAGTLAYTGTGLGSSPVSIRGTGILQVGDGTTNGVLPTLSGGTSGIFVIKNGTAQTFGNTFNAAPNYNFVANSNLNPTSYQLGVFTKDGPGALTINNAIVANQFHNRAGTTILDTGSNVLVNGYNSVGQFGGDNAVLTIKGLGKITDSADFNVSDLSGSIGVVNIGDQGAVTAANFYVGKSGTAIGVVNQTLGSVLRSGGGADWRIGGGTGTGDVAAYGAYNLSGGTFTNAQNFQVGAYGRGIWNQTGGVSSFGSWVDAGRFAGSNGVINVTGGTLSMTNTATAIFSGEDGSGVITVSGTGIISSATTTGAAVTGLRLGHTATGAGIVNLNTGGTAITTGVTRGAGTGVLNFNGGTLRANTGVISASFLTGLNSANVFAGGANIDTNGLAATIAQPLLAPAGNGVVTIPVTSGGSGYLSEPQVNISGLGTGASARANVVGGVVTSITITGPGINYSAVPTVSLSGGLGAGGVAAVLGTPTTGANATTGGLNKLNTGALTVTGVSTYGGATTITGGSIISSSALASTNQLPNTPLILSGGSLSVTETAAVVATQTFNGVTLNSPAVISGTIFTGGTTNLTLGAITKNAGGAVDFVLPATGFINTSSTNTNSILGGYATVNSGANWASGGGNITAMTTYTANTATTWTAAANTDQTVATTGLVASSTTNSVRFNTATPLTVVQAAGTTSTILSGGILITPTATTAANLFSGGTINSGSTSTDLVIHDYGTAATAFSMVSVVGAGTGGLVKAGPGLIVLSNPTANLYTGATTIGAGTLRVGVTGNFAIPDTSVVSIAAGATLDLNSFSETIGGLAGYGTVTTGVAGTPTLTISQAGNTTFSGTILNGTGTGTIVTKTGAGTLTLNNLTLAASSTYTGATNINGGAIKIATPFALANNTLINVNVANGLLFDTTIPQISGLGGNSNVTLATVGGAPVQLTIGNNNAASTFTGTLTGSGTLIKIGTGLQFLNGNNTNAGGVISNTGFLQLNGNNSGAPAAPMIANSGGTIQIANLNAIYGASGTNIVLASGGTLAVQTFSANPTSLGVASIQSVLGRLDPGSTGVLALQTDSTVQAQITENLDFTNSAEVSLGASLTNSSGNGTSNVNYTGVITPRNNMFRLGGSGGRLYLPNGATLAGANNLTLFGGGSSQGLVFLDAAYGYTGSTFVNQGQTYVNKLANGGTASSLGAASSAASNLILNGGTLTYIGDTAASTDRLFTLSAAPTTIESSGTAPVNFTNTGNVEFLNGGNRTLTLQGNNTALNTLAASINDSPNQAVANNGAPANGTTAITKTGAGTWVLSGNNSFIGGVTINAGVLGFTNAASIGNSASFGPASILVNGGGAVGLFGSLQTGIQATLNRISPLSSGTIALTADTAEAINFDGGSAGAQLSLAYLGAYGNVSYTGTLTPMGTQYRLGGGGGVLTIPNAGGNSLTGARALLIGGGGPGTGFVNNPNLNGAVVLGGSNDFTGGVQLLSGGILSATNVAALGSGPLKFQGGVYRAVDATDISLASDGVTARDIRIGPDTSNTAGTALIDVVGGVNLSLSKPFGVPVTYAANQGQAALTKYGAGTLTLAGGLNLTLVNGGNSNNSGTLTIERGTVSLLTNPTSFNGNIQVGSNNGGVGTLKLGANNVFGSGITVYATGSIVDLYNGSNIDLAGFSDTFRAVRGMGGIINTGASTANLTLGTNNEQEIIGGNLVGNFTLTVGGNNTSTAGGIGNANALELWNNYNSGFTGKLVANSGSLRIRGDGALGSTTEAFAADKITLNNGASLQAMNPYAPVTIGANHGITIGANGGTLSAPNTNALIVNSPITGPGMLTIGDETGTVYLNNSGNNYAGGTSITSASTRGWLSIGTGGTTGNLPAGDFFFNSAAGGGRLYFFHSDAMTVSNNINGPGYLLQIGGGTTTLNGNNSTGQPTWVGGGRLVADFSTGNTPIGILTNLNINGGAFEYVAPSGTNILKLGTLGLGAFTGPPSTGAWTGGLIGDSTLQSTYNGSGTQTMLFTGFTKGGTGSTLNFVTSGVGSVNGVNNLISIAGATPAAVLNASAFYNGDFAAVDLNGFVRAPNFGSDVNTAVLNTLVTGKYSKLTSSLINQGPVQPAGVELVGSGVNLTFANTANTTSPFTPGTILKSGGGGLAGVSIISGGTMPATINPQVTTPATITTNGTELILRTDTTDDFLRIDMPFAGAGTITKSGNGTLILTGASTAMTGSVLVAGGTVNVTGNAVFGANTAGTSIRLANSGSSNVTMNLDSATATINAGFSTQGDAFRIGEAGTATFNQSAGTVNANQFLTIGDNLGAVGTYNMTGGTLNVKQNNASTPALVVGRAGTGTLNIGAGSTVNVKNGAQFLLGNGVINSTAVTFQSALPNVGVSTGVGTVTQTGGTVTIDTNNAAYQSQVFGALILGVDGTGTYNLNGGTLTSPIIARGNGVANFNLGGGTIIAPTPVPTIGNNSILNLSLPIALTGIGGNGTINTNGSNVASLGTLSGVGGLVKAGTGTLTVQGASTFTGGTAVNTGNIVASGTSLGAGNVNLASGTTLQIAGVQTGLQAKFVLGALTQVNPNLTTGSTIMQTELASVGSLDNYLAGKAVVAVESTTARGKLSVNYLENGGANGNSSMPPALIALNNGSTPYTADLRGSFNAPTTGDYTFQTRADDAAVIFIDGQPVLNNNYQQGQITRTGTINLSGGAHDIVIAYYNNSGGSGFSVGVTLPGQGQSYLTNTNELNASNGLFSNGSNILNTGSLSGSGNVQLSTTRVDGTVNSGSLITGGDNTNTAFSGNIQGAGSLTKVGTGTQTLSGTNNTYTQATNINGGTLMMGGNNVLPDTAALNLSTGATLATGGFSDNTGALSVNGAASIDTGAGTGTLNFASVTAWADMLNIWNYTGAAWTPGSDKITFTNTAGIDFNKVNFYGGGQGDFGSLIGTGGGGLIGNELVPVPEPSAIMSLLALFGLAGYKERRRFFHFRK